MRLLNSKYLKIPKLIPTGLADLPVSDEWVILILKSFWGGILILHHGCYSRTVWIKDCLESINRTPMFTWLHDDLVKP